MSTQRQKAEAWASTLRSQIGIRQHGHVLCIYDGRLVLVPDDLAQHSPKSLTTAQRNRIIDVGPIGLSEED